MCIIKIGEVAENSSSCTITSKENYFLPLWLILKMLLKRKDGKAHITCSDINYDKALFDLFGI